MEDRSESATCKTPSRPRQVLISGYSGRAVAWSAVRAGLQPIVLDECQDLDLPPDSSPAAGSTLADFPAEIPFLPTGGWENRLDELNRIESSRPLWSSSPSSIKQARNPLQLQQHLDQHGFDSLGIRTAEKSWLPQGKTCVREWIRKSRDSTGGMAVRRVHSGDSSLPGVNEFDQQFVEGELFSAQFFSTEGEHEFLGITRQIAGCPELPPRPFAYVGNISCSAGESVAFAPEVEPMGQLLGDAFSLSGPWGIDLCRHESGLYVLELNPRYTAAMEVLELATGQSLLQRFHGTPVNRGRPVDVIVGKATVYAPHDFRLPASWNWSEIGAASYSCWDVPEVSDLARPGTPFEAGDPVCTVWQKAVSAEICFQSLERRRGEIHSALGNALSHQSEPCSPGVFQPGRSPRLL